MPNNLEECEMALIELYKAVLCLDCNLIHEDVICPRCASAQGYLITDWIKETKLETPININSQVVVI